MDRRRPALVALLAFAGCTLVAVLVSGSRPHLDQGDAPWAFQLAGYLCALVAGVLLLAPDAGGTPADRRTGLVVVAAVVVLALIDALTAAADEGGANIGAGLVRLVTLVVVAVMTVRLALDGRAPGRRPS
jgi:peptidoglycan/LPS O-acetylase OafA/YrhL